MWFIPLLRCPKGKDKDYANDDGDEDDYDDDDDVDDDEDDDDGDDDEVQFLPRLLSTQLG